MQSFKDWLNTSESSPTTRALDAPWAYPALYVGGNPFSNGYSPKRIKNYKSMVNRDSRKKKAKKPNNTIDAFVREMELLKQDLARLSDKKRKDRDEQKQDQKSKPVKPVKVEVDDDLKKVAKIVVANLKHAPDYYVRLHKIDRLADIEKQPTLKKLRRVDIKQMAHDLGLDFDKVKFTPEAFRRGVEAELQRNPDGPSSDKTSKDQSVQKTAQEQGKE